MRLVVLLFCGLVIQTNSFAQSAYSIPNATNAQSDIRFSSFISSLKATKKSDLKLVRVLFNKAHRDYLKNYVAYSQVDDIFNKGNYDCLSGTYFFAHALEELNIPYKIYETNYHIFLKVQTDKCEVLLETTDRFNGLVQNKKAIDERIALYKETRSVHENSELYLSGIKIFHELQSQQLPGLLYYNRAIVAFNKNDLSSCCSYLEKAWKIYDNQRIEIFTPILLHAIAHSQMEKADKEKLIQIIQAHRQSSLHTIAFR